jgi:hypothetical protein
MMYTTKIRKKFLAFIKYLKMTVLTATFSSPFLYANMQNKKRYISNIFSSFINLYP